MYALLCLPFLTQYYVCLRTPFIVLGIFIDNFQCCIVLHNMTVYTCVCDVQYRGPGSGSLPHVVFSVPINSVESYSCPTWNPGGYGFSPHSQLHVSVPFLEHLVDVYRSLSKSMSILFIYLYIHICWRKKWQSTSVFLPGKSHEQGSYSPRGRI